MPWSGENTCDSINKNQLVRRLAGSAAHAFPRLRLAHTRVQPAPFGAAYALQLQSISADEFNGAAVGVGRRGT